MTSLENSDGCKMNRTSTGSPALICAASRLAVVLVLIALAASSSAQDLFYDAYQRGQKAFAAGDLAEAKQMFQRALDLDPRQSRQKRFVGMRFEVYLPEYYLARISFREKQYDAALASFNRLVEQGLIRQGHPEYATLTEERTASERERAQLVAAARPAPAPPPSQQPAPAPPPAPPPTTASAPAGNPPPRAQDDGRKPEVAQAPKSGPEPPPAIDTRPGPPAPTPDPTRTAARGGPEAVAVNTSSLTEMRRLLTEAGSALGARDFETSAQLLARLQQLPGGVEQSTPLVTRFTNELVLAGDGQLQRGDVGGAARASALLTRVAPVSPRVRQFQQRLDERVALTRIERDTLRALLLGEYPRVADVAASWSQRGSPSGRLLFYAACGRAGLALTAQGDARARLTSEARQLFEQSVRAGASVTKERPLISPEILSLLQSR